jgi:hypothetical protein
VRGTRYCGARGAEGKAPEWCFRASTRLLLAAVARRRVVGEARGSGETGCLASPGLGKFKFCKKSIPVMLLFKRGEKVGEVSGAVGDSGLRPKGDML